MRGRQVDDARDEAVGVVVHRLPAAGVQHVDPHLLHRPAQALAEEGARRTRPACGAISVGGLRRAAGCPRASASSVCDRLVDELLSLRRQRREMLDQPGDQRLVQRRPRAHERGRKQPIDFVHAAVYHRWRGPVSTGPHARREIVTELSSAWYGALVRRRPGARCLPHAQAVRQRQHEVLQHAEAPFRARRDRRRLRVQPVDLAEGRIAHAPISCASTRTARCRCWWTATSRCPNRTRSSGIWARSIPTRSCLPRLDGSAGVLQARAQILRFLGIASTAIYPAYSDWWNATNSDDPAKRNPAAADAALARVKRALGVLEKTLGVRRAFGGCVFARRRRERVHHVLRSSAGCRSIRSRASNACAPGTSA